MYPQYTKKGKEKETKEKTCVQCVIQKPIITKTWAGVTRLESVWMTAAIAAKHNLKLWRIDFVGAYLNSVTKEDIYMKQPEGFVQPGFEDHVCKLIHTIYGTMQGAHDWYETLTNTYNKLGYTTSRADPCVRYKADGNEYTMTDTYTDDVFGASKTDGEIAKRKDEIGKEWEIKDVRENEYFLGMHVQQDLTLGTIRLNGHIGNMSQIALNSHTRHLEIPHFQ
jgi:hypothetical protein